MGNVGGRGPPTGRLLGVLETSSGRLRRDVALLLIGALFGGAVAAGIALVVDDDAAPSQTAAEGDGAESPDDTAPVIDPTKTDFGDLTEEGSSSGVKIQWTAEILEGPDTGVVEFVTAHRNGTTVLEYEGKRVIDTGKAFTVCEGACKGADADAARAALPPLVRPFWEAIRLVEETTSNPEYRITGETQLESGIFERCGTFDPGVFGVAVPDNVNLVSQCVDAQRGVPIRLGLAGEQRTVGGASLTAIADADADLFKT